MTEKRTYITFGPLCLICFASDLSENKFYPCLLMSRWKDFSTWPHHAFLTVTDACSAHVCCEWFSLTVLLDALCCGKQSRNYQGYLGI